jgi:hypothetical protein
VFLVLHRALALRAPVAARPVAPASRFLRALTFLTFLAVAVLAGTGFYAVLGPGHISGWILFLHMGAAGPFVALLFPFVVLRPFVLVRPPRPALTAQVAFWVFAVAALASLASMLLSMLPLLATEDLERLLVIHRYAGLTLVIALVVHLALGRASGR